MRGDLCRPIFGGPKLDVWAALKSSAAKVVSSPEHLPTVKTIDQYNLMRYRHVFFLALLFAFCILLCLHG